jgi:transposase
MEKSIPEPAGAGRRPANNKECFEAVLYLLRTGCQWSELPQDYPPKSTVHDRFQAWCERGIFTHLLGTLLLEYDDLYGLGWDWLSADAAMTKAPLGGGKNREKPYRPRKVWYKAPYLV